MKKELISPESQPLQLAPEDEKALQMFLTTHDSEEVAKATGRKHSEIIALVNSPVAKEMQSTLAQQVACKNFERFDGIFSQILNMKLEEINESQVATQKDIVDVMKIYADIQNNHIKAMAAANRTVAPTRQNNIQINNNGTGDAMLDQLASVWGK